MSVFHLLSLQGPKSIQALNVVFPDVELPEDAWHFTEYATDDGSIYICRRPRFGNEGFDLFIPESQKEVLQEQLKSAVRSQGGAEVGETASELARIQSGVPRMGVDMTSDHLVQETGLTSSAISFRKGCYIGQEVI